MTGRAYAGLRVLPSARELRPDERTVIDQLLSAPFEGRDAIRSQLANARVVAEGEADTRTIKFELAPGERRLALTKLRVPVEAEILDEDRVPIALLLHVLDGLATELEIFRADGQPIKQRDLTTLRSVVVNEAR